MKGLLIKDSLVLWRQSKLMLLIVAVYGILPTFSGSSSFLACFAVVFCAMLPITLMALDERSRADRYFLTLPYSRTQVVVSRYLMGLLLMAAALLFTGAATLLYGLFHGEVLAEQFLPLLPVVCVGLLFDAVIFPLLFKLGVEKGRLYFIIVMVMIYGGSTVYFMVSDINLSQFFDRFTLGTGALLGVGCLVLWLLSMALSVKIYQRRAL